MEQYIIPMFLNGCKKGDHELVKAFLKENIVDPNVHDCKGLFWAVYKGYPKVVNVFLKDGRVDVNHRWEDWDNRNAIELSRCKGTSECGQLIKDWCNANLRCGMTFD